MFFDPIADTVSRFNVAIKSRHKFVLIENFVINWRLLEVLYAEGCIKTFYYCFYSLKIKVFLKFFKNRPLLKGLKNITSSGSHKYLKNVTFNEVFFKKGFSGFFIISTIYGLLTNNHLCFLTFDKKISGELLIFVEYY